MQIESVSHRLTFSLASCSTGVFAFFFFSGRVKAFEDTAPTLNYYWVPILASVVFPHLPVSVCYK